MKRITTPAPPAATALVTDAWDAVGASFERFCLTAGVATLTRMMEEDATALCGQRHERLSGRAAYRWGKNDGEGWLPRRQDRGRTAAGARAFWSKWLK